MRLTLTSLLIATLLKVPPTTAADDVLQFQLFFGAQDVAFWAGLKQGFFSEQNLDVNYTYTTSGGKIRGNLVDGTIDMAMAAADNSVAIAKEGSLILTGGDSSLNEFILQPQVNGLEDMKNKTLIVDFPTTAYALQAYKALDLANVSQGDYDVVIKGATNLRYQAMVNASNRDQFHGTPLYPPFSILATERDGLKSAGRMVDLVGGYQASCLFAMRQWLQQDVSNADKAIRFIAGFVNSLRWTMDMDNMDSVIDILMDELEIDEDVAMKTYDLLMEPGFGLEKDMEFLQDGFSTVLGIRDQFEGGGPFVSSDFVDFSYYNAAMAIVNGKNESVTQAPSPAGKLHLLSNGALVVGIGVMLSLTFNVVL